MDKFVVYYRVSTKKQGYGGLGMTAQENAVQSFLRGRDAQVLSTFAEVDSGAKTDRVELQKALRECRLTGATLLIAKLDRLSRCKRFLFELMDSSVEFVCADMPEANHFTVSLMACLADYERQMISERTRAAMKVAKEERGVKFGNPKIHELSPKGSHLLATKARVENAKQRNEQVREVISEMFPDEKPSLRVIAAELNNAGYTTTRGKQWQPMSVKRVLN